MSIQDRILSELAIIEEKEGMTILLAVESGRMDKEFAL